MIKLESNLYNELIVNNNDAKDYLYTYWFGFAKFTRRKKKPIKENVWRIFAFLFYLNDICILE